MQIDTPHIWTDIARLGGVPCLRGHRIPMSQILRAVTNEGIDAFCSDFDHLKKEEVVAAMEELSQVIDR